MTVTPAEVPKLDVVGVPLAVTDYEQAMDVMDGMIERRAGRLDKATAKAVAQKLKGFLGSA